jgi:hypothetical protein
MGCTMILAGADDDSRKEMAGFGIFNRAVYDEEDGLFLGCVGYSQYWSNQTDDKYFKVARAFGALMAASTTLATLLCLLIQCFNKHGKSSLWVIMKWAYALAFVSQGLMFTVWFAEICDKSQCEVGSNGVAAFFNTVFLFGMVIASFNSLPPRNPVFRCWNVVSTEYETDKLDTDDSNSEHSYDQENPDMMKRRGRRHDDTDNEDDYYQRSSAESVSLFGGSRTKSVSSRREGAVRSGTGPGQSGSDRTSRSECSSSTKKPIAIDDEERSTTSSNRSKQDPPSVGSYNSNDQKTSKKSRAAAKSSAPKTALTTLNEERSLDTSSFPDTSKYGEGSSVRTSKTGVSSVRSSKTGASSSVRSSKTGASSSVRSSKTEETSPIDRNQESVTYDDDASARSGSVRSSKNQEGSVQSASTRSRVTDVESETESEASFLNRLERSVRLERNGTRVSEMRIGKKLEIVDEYPATSTTRRKPHIADSTDIVKVRTEYCPVGRKTIKETMHYDGSRTVTTLIDPMNIDDEIDLLVSRP